MRPLLYSTRENNLARRERERTFDKKKRRERHATGRIHYVQPV